ncbi:MAG: alpha/beta fold hydrolase [Vicinamibacterales bacterium]
MTRAIAVLAMSWTVLTAQPTVSVLRTEWKVQGVDGLTLAVRQVSPPTAATGVPVVLLHGARVPGVASFDLPVAGGSLAADLALDGHDVYVMDARGYGRSTRLPGMDVPPRSGVTLARSNEIVRDIGAIVDWIRTQRGGRAPVLVGWATGGHWVGHYASLSGERVAGVVLLNTLYGGTPTHPSLGRGSDLEDREHPGEFARAYGSYRLSTAASLLPAWDRSIPGDDKTAWRDPLVANAYVGEAMASDDTSGSRTPASFRAPSGAMEDSFLLATGRRLWDASLITCPTLVVRSEADFWSRPEDLEMLRRHLTHAPARFVSIPGATHFVHLDRPEHGRARLLDELRAFLRDPAAAAAR